MATEDSITTRGRRPIPPRVLTEGDVSSWLIAQIDLRDFIVRESGDGRYLSVESVGGRTAIIPIDSATRAGTEEAKAAFLARVRRELGV